MEVLKGFFAPALVYLYIFLLHLILPGRRVTGYVTAKNSGEKLRYRLNGLLVLVIVLLTWLIAGFAGFMPWDWLYVHRWYALAGAVTFGLIFSFAIVLPNIPVRKSFLSDLFFGRLENPQWLGGRIDVKMWLYLAGAVMLQLNVLSFMAHHNILFGDAGSPGFYISAALLSFFVIDYLTFEEVHLYTYDFIAERVGFKLGFGCLAFYPFFYSIPLWATVELPDTQIANPVLVIYALVFFTGWCLSRGANLQKYLFKKTPGRGFLGISPRTISNGDKSLLVNGFWGISRHINYLGEIIMAIGIVLCTGYPMLPWGWLYPLYYIALLFTRQSDDNRRCAQKYGLLWDQYTKKVPFRIIPYIY